MKKELIPTYIGLALPVVLALVVFGYVQMSQVFPNPTQDFVFTAERYDPCTTYTHKLSIDTKGEVKKTINTEAVAKERLLHDNDVEYMNDPCKDQITVVKETPDMYRYDFVAGQIVKVPSEDVLKMNIKTESPDGYVVSFSRDFQGGYYGPGVFTGYAPSEMYLKKGDKKKKLDTSTFTGLSDQYNFKIIGWVTN